MIPVLRLAVPFYYFFYLCTPFPFLFSFFPFAAHSILRHFGLTYLLLFEGMFVRRYICQNYTDTLTLFIWLYRATTSLTKFASTPVFPSLILFV